MIQFSSYVWQQEKLSPCSCSCSGYPFKKHGPFEQPPFCVCMLANSSLLAYLFVFSCKCRSPGCHAVCSLSGKPQVLACNFTVRSICLSCKKVHFAGIMSGPAALLTSAVPAAFLIPILGSPYHSLWHGHLQCSVCCDTARAGAQS